MNKKYRQELKQLKYKKRVRRWVNTGGTYRIWNEKKKEWVDHPTTTDAIEQNALLFFKTTGKPCSCIMCSGDKYKRHEKKRDDKRLLEDGLAE